MHRPISLSLLLLVTLVPASAKPQQATFIVLGDFGGIQLSGDGSLATAGDSIVWQNGVLIDEFLGFLPGGDVPNRLGSSFTIAHDVNYDGSVIVGRATCSSALSALCPSLEQQAFRWENGIIMELGTLSGSRISQAFGVSEDGSVVVGIATEGSFRWENGTMSGLGMRARRVSADGFVAVGYVVNSPDEPEVEPARWEGGVVTGLGTLENCNRARATSASGDGSVVVGNGCGNGWRWVAGHGPGTGMSSLGLLPGATRSEPTTVSGDGSIVVGNAGYPDGDPDQFDEAFIWDETNGIRNLQDVLVNDFGVDFMGWTLRSAEDMSLDAGTIVGWARDENGQQAAYIVPEPGNLYALVAGTAFLGLLYRRRTRGLRLG